MARIDGAEISLAAGPAYRRGVMRLLLGLLGFALTYLGLLTGCVAAVVVTVDWAVAAPWLWPVAVLVTLVFGPLLWFLLRGLLHRPALTRSVLTIDARTHPRLLAFIEELAADAGAPTPGRISLSCGVNAAMVRGHSTLGSLVGGRRELVIGLGLVNVLDVREFRAALAHEFGHFAQSSTRVGQWAHRATIVLREIVLGRARFDARLARVRTGRSVALRGLASLLSVGVRGARVMLAGLLGRITRLSLALARELEFNADLHAVALCGSDPLVAALWRAQRGALAMNAALAALSELAKHGVFSADLYAHHQARGAEFDERVGHRDDPMWAALRRPYRYGPELHFPAGEAPAEVMWYSHPSYREREANAKRSYVAVAEERLPSAWSLFDNVPDLRQELTRSAYAQLGVAPDPGALRPAAEVEERIADELAERAQGSHHHGFYDNRVVDPGPIDVLVDDLQDQARAQTLDHEQLRAEVDLWRGAPLAEFMVRWRATEASLERTRGALARPAGDARGRVDASAQLELAEAERTRQLDEAREGDRAVFRWLWARAEVSLRAELVERQRFSSLVQRYIVTLNLHHAHVNKLFAAVDAREYELASHAPVELLSALDALHRDLLALLLDAKGVPLPQLRNLEAGRPLATSLLLDPLIDGLDHEAELGPWLRGFMAQVTTVHGRLRTLHYKNLGQLLALHERIDPQAQGSAERGAAPRTGPIT